MNANNDHPSHADPFQVGVFTGALVFLGTFIGLYVTFPSVHFGFALGVGSVASISVSILFVRLLRSYQLKRDAAYFQAKRDADQRQTQKAITEMNRELAEKER